MGQQQLLLVILVTIIVGIATVVAINTFGTAADQANVDAVTNDVATLASAAQGFYMRPAMLGGGSRTFNSGGYNDAGVSFEGLAFPADEVATDFRTARNENGVYVIGSPAVDDFLISAYPASCDGYSASLTPSCTDNEDIITATVEPNSFRFGS